MAYEKDDTTGLFEWIGQALDTTAFLKSRLAFGVVIGVAATMLFTHILFQMERHNATYKAAAMEAALGERDTQLELEEDNDTNNNTNSPTKKEPSKGNSDYVQADFENINTNKCESSLSSSSPEKSDQYKPGDSRRRLNRVQQSQIVANVAVLLLFNYLLLVFQPGSVALSFVAMMAVWVLVLQSYWRDELRRARFDRCIAMVALFFVLAGCFTLITYCHLALREGSIYEGPARIVGYNDTIYSNTDGETLRADLDVAWGGTWGCPDSGAVRFCTATVQGALCESKYNPDDENTRKANRRRQAKETIVEEVQGYENEMEEEEVQEETTNARAANSAEQSPSSSPSSVEEKEEADEEEIAEEYSEALDVDIEEVEEEDEEEIDEIEEEDNETITELEDEVEEEAEGEVVLDEEVTVLEGQNKNETAKEVEQGLLDEIDSEAEKVAESKEEETELDEENEELEDELDSEVEYNNELEDEINDLEGGVYSYDDTFYEDDYWQQDWSAVWGETACADLFDSDAAGEGYVANDAPGHDAWPTVMIYGSCNSCQAYVQDYYSTEHFQDISKYEFQSWLYLMTGFVLLVFAAIAALFERRRPTKDNKVVLLSQDGGVLA